MRIGFVVPFADTREFAGLAALGEECGWDGVFTWEALFGVDAWVTLGAAAMVTERIRLGTLLTPVSRVRPWDLASRVGTVDRVSGGRAILGAGLGALHEGWTAFEPDEGRRVRAQKFDESLAIYAGLMAGQPFASQGEHYSAKPTDFNLPPPPVQRPRPPVWVVGALVGSRTRQASLERAARWDGLLPQVVSKGTDGRPQARHVASPDELADLVGRVRVLRERDGLPGAATTSSSRPTARANSCSCPGRPQTGRTLGARGGSRAGGVSRRGPPASRRWSAGSGAALLPEPRAATLPAGAGRDPAAAAARSHDRCAIPDGDPVRRP